MEIMKSYNDLGVNKFAYGVNKFTLTYK